MEMPPLNLGLSKSLGILYGNASIAVSVTILIIDILLKEPIGIAMFIDAVVVGKAVDFFNWIHPVSPCQSLLTAIPVMVAGLFVLAYTQYTYMKASLGCGPRDTLMVGLAKRLRKLPIALVSIALLSTATFVGWLLGGPVGIGTIICAFGAGPVMQFAFRTVRFDATGKGRSRSIPLQATRVKTSERYARDKKGGREASRLKTILQFLRILAGTLLGT